MIREQQETEIDRIMEIWLDTNQKAHSFISPKYWEEHFASVKEMMPKARVYVYEEEKSGEILGFVGLSGDYIAGIFVCDKCQSQGVGKQLMDFVKSIKGRLSLHVYRKNKGAVAFYKREGFTVASEEREESTGEQEYFMVWKQR